MLDFIENLIVKRNQTYQLLDVRLRLLKFNPKTKHMQVIVIQVPADIKKFDAEEIATRLASHMKRDTDYHDLKETQSGGSYLVPFLEVSEGYDLSQLEYDTETMRIAAASILDTFNLPFDESQLLTNFKDVGGKAEILKNEDVLKRYFSDMFSQAYKSSIGY